MNPVPLAPALMHRREALARLALVLGSTLVGAEFFLNGTRASGQELGPRFSAADQTLLDAIGETIIPATDTPGAQAVQIGAFMIMMAGECYTLPQQRIFHAGLTTVDAAAKKLTGKTFLAASATERTTLLNQLDAEARLYSKENSAEAPPHYFKLYKQLTLLGYFTSEIGATQALRYLEVPGAYRGNDPYRKGDRAWYTPTGAGL